MNLLKKSLLNCCGGTAADSQDPRTPVETPKRTVPDDSASFQQLKRIMEELKTYNDSVKALNGKIDALQNHSSITVLSTSSGNSKTNNHPSTDVGIPKNAVIDNSASSEQFQSIKNELQQYNASLKALNDKMGVLQAQNVLNHEASFEPSRSEYAVTDIVALDRPVIDDSASSGHLKLILDELQKYHVSLKSFHEKGGGVANHSVQYEFSKIPKYDNLSNVKMACLQIKKFILSNRHEADLMDKGDDINIIINVIYQILSGEWYDHLKKNAKEETPEEDLCTCLKAIAEAALSLGDNNDLLWLIIPIHRLLFELLQCLSSTVAKTGIIKNKGKQPKDEKDVQMDREHLAKLMLRLSPVIENINSLPEITVSCRLTKTITSSLEKLFVEHLKDCAAAIGNVVVGLVKSFLNRML
jgi:beta-N-acetylglucosaminidase